MPADIDFSRRDDIKRWLSNRPPKVAVMFSARAALRVAPLLVGAFAARTAFRIAPLPLLVGALARGDAAKVAGRDIVLPAFRAMAVPWVVGQFPNDETTRHAARAARAANAGLTAKVANTAVAHATAAANCAAYTAYTATSEAYQQICAAATDAALHAGSAVRAADANPGYATRAAAADAEIFDRGASMYAIAARPLWLMETPAWARDAWQRLEETLLKENQDWLVWTDWYRARLEGKRTNHELEIARVSITDEIWRQGPRAVNAALARSVESVLSRQLSISDKQAASLDRETLAHDFRHRPRDVAVIMAARAALRVAPLLADALGPRGDGATQKVVLPVFRVMTASWVAGHYPAYGAEARADVAVRNAAYTSHTDTVRYTTYAASNGAYAAARDAAYATDACVAAHAAAIAAADTGGADAAAAYAADAQIIDQLVSASALAARPLWLTEIPTWARHAWRRLGEALLKENQDWLVWTDWYRARLEGERVNEAPEIARVMIANELWSQGPRTVNAEIARLIEQQDHEILERTSQDWDFFLSYSREDEPFARWIEKLLKVVERSVFAEFTEMPVGSNFVREMQRGLARSSRFMALLSPAYVKSDHCQAEWSAAFNADPGGATRKLVPFLVCPTELPPLARQIVYKPLVGLSSADAATAILQAIGYEGTVSEIPSGWPTVALEQMHALTGGVYDVAPGAELLLERQPTPINEASEAGFTPEQLFADFAREVVELTEHVNQSSGNIHCSIRLKERVVRLHQSVTVTFTSCDVLAINKRLVWVLRAIADDKNDGVIPPNDLLEHYASDLYGYYKRLEFIFPKLKPFREMDARQRFTLPSEEEERAIREVYRSFGDHSAARGALSVGLSDEMKQVGESIEEAKEVATKKGVGDLPDVRIESHVDAATRSLAVWGWLSNPREKISRSGRSVEESEKAIKDYEQLYDRMSPQMIKYIGYLLKWFF
jgi:hypothetical protein